MILLYIFLLGCAVTGIVALGVIFALAAAGFGDVPEHEDFSQDNKLAVTEAAEPQPTTERHFDL